MTQTLYSDGEEGERMAARTAQKTLASQSLVVSDSRRHVATSVRRGAESFRRALRWPRWRFGLVFRRATVPGPVSGELTRLRKQEDSIAANAGLPP
jgi:hypothetical protein